MILLMHLLRMTDLPTPIYATNRTTFMHMDDEHKW